MGSFCKVRNFLNRALLRSIQVLCPRFLWATFLAHALVLGISACTVGGDRLGQTPASTERQESTATKTEDRNTTRTQIYAGEAWYQARPEPEESWEGVLRPRQLDRGPASRNALRYELISGQDEFAVYAANAESVLESFVGRKVLITGKLVDLSDEGYGQELWIASVVALETNEDGG